MNTIYLAASGDSRLSANRNCWPTQSAMENQLKAVLEREGALVQRAHPYDPDKEHGFIDSQKYGIDVFKSIPPKSPLIVAESVWQYSHHVLPGLFSHQGPILTVANWSGTWPGLVGLLNLNASLTKAGVRFSSLWSQDFEDEFFLGNLRTWLADGSLEHDISHVRPYDRTELPSPALQVGEQFARQLRDHKTIMGVFDEGCMGMYNAIIPDELLMPLGFFKERLSQSALYAKMRTVSNEEARGIYQWLQNKGMRFDLGSDGTTQLTETQVLEQCKMYIAALRLADEFGCATIGIQYQLGLKDLTPASDLVEGLLNNVDRPPVNHEVTGQVLFEGEALPHFNEVDECAGLDALVTYHLWRQLGYQPETTLHDLRWGRTYDIDGEENFIWILEISGAVPPAHLAGGYRGAVSERQPLMYFPYGGGTIKGISKPGWIVWSRIFVEDGKLNCDLGLGESVQLTDKQVNENWELTTSQWPMMHIRFPGISRDQMMARHKSNHIQVVYTPDRESATYALYAKAAALNELGINVFICGHV